VVSNGVCVGHIVAMLFMIVDLALDLAVVLGLIFAVPVLLGAFSRGAGKAVKRRHTNTLQHSRSRQVPAKHPAKAVFNEPATTHARKTKPQRAQATSPRASVRIVKQRPPKQVGFAKRPPRDSFVLMCECPHCGALDTHNLRVPVRPHPRESTPEDTKCPDQQEKSWWDTMLGLFADTDEKKVHPPCGAAAPKESGASKRSEPPWWDVTSWFTKAEPAISETKAAETDPMADHPASGVVRSCRTCDHVWAQLEPA
jgi:hypothetical protein